MSFHLSQSRAKLKQAELSLKTHHPRHQLLEKRHRLADLEERLLSQITERARKGADKGRLRAERLKALRERRLEADKRRLAVKSERLWGLSPLKQLSRGYAFATDEKGKRLQSVRQAPVGSAITVHVTDGRLVACVRENQEERHG